MALHSLKIVGEEQEVSISFENDPLSFLLILCDELQIWDRERPDASSESSIFRSTDIEYLNIDDYKIKAVLRHMPYRGMEISRKKHVSPLIDKISEDSVRLSKFLKSQPLSINIKNYIQGLEDIDLPEIHLE